MDLIKLFCDIDDFCLNFEANWKQTLLSSNSPQEKTEKKCRLTQA